MPIIDNSNSPTKIDEEPGQDLKGAIPSSQVQFWTFLTFEIPSLACTIFLLYHLLFNPQLRKALHNHVIIILLFITLFIEIFDIPLYIDAHRFGGHKNSFPMFMPVCRMWWLMDYGFYGAITVFLAWGSVERHVLVFHHRQLLRTQRQRFFIHYLPLIIITVYLLGFYIGVIFFPPCQNTYKFESLVCGSSPCYKEMPYLSMWDYFGNRICCTFIETMFSIILIIRILCQKRRAHQRVIWRKYRKMAFQLLSISCLQLTIVFPRLLIVGVQKVGGPTTSRSGAAVDPYFFYLYTFVILLLPFICLGFLPELWPKLLCFKPHRQPVVGAVTTILNQCQSIPTHSRHT